MSSDLWSAFASTPDDLSVNPWSQNPNDRSDGLQQPEEWQTKAAKDIGTTLWSNENKEQPDADDFGDFEQPQTKMQLDDWPAGDTQSTDTISVSGATHAENMADSVRQKNGQGATVPASEDWGDFSPPLPTGNEPSKAIEATSAASQLQGRTPANASIERADHAESTGLAPTNVPPPSILLRWLSELVSRMSTRLRSTSDAEERLRSAHCLRVAARILAGRKLRWKRDKLLNQGMSIASAGKSKGMKLTGVDKAEAQREDREAVELVRTWQHQSGVIRGALREQALPDISTTTIVQATQPIIGGRGCFLCGLKREERVHKVDVNVWDHFDDFWTEHWGHTGCKLVWEQHKQSLKHR